MFGVSSSRSKDSGSVKTKIIFTLLGLGLVLFTFFWKESIPPADFQWHEQETQKYQLNISSKTQFHSNAEMGTTLRIRGLLQLHVFSNVHPIQLGFRLNDAEVFSNGVVDSEMKDLYSTPFLATMNSHGRFLNFFFPETLEKDQKNRLKHMILPFETILRSKKAWDTRQNDAIGEYEAKYEQITPKTFNRTKTHYLLKGPESPNVEIHTSSGQFNLTASLSWLEQSKISETLLISPLNDQPILSTQNHFSLELLGKDQSSLIWSQMTFLEAQSQLNQTSTKRNIDPPSLEKRPREGGLIEILERLSENESQAKLSSFQEYLSLHPKEISELPQIFMTQGLKEGLYVSMMNVLARLGTPESQQVLLRLLDEERQSTQNRIQAAKAFSKIQQPLSDEIQRELMARIERLDTEEDTREIYSMAILALGTIGKNLRDKYPQESQRIESLLVSELENANTTKQASCLLSALGNLEDSRNASLFESYLQHENQNLRKAAVEAYQYMKPEIIQTPLLNRLRLEKNTEIIDVIASLLQRCSLSVSDAQIIFQKILSESDPTSRQKLLQLWTQNTPSESRTEEQIRELLENEDSEPNRELLSKALPNL